MQNMEEKIKDVITESLESGIVEKLVKENFEKGLNNAISDLVGHYGSVTKQIKDQLETVLVKQLENVDYSEYVIKLDDVLTGIVKEAQVDNRKILENFKYLMADEDEPKRVKMSELFEKYQDFVSKNISTYNLEVNFDDDVSYDDTCVTLEIEHIDKRWSSMREANLCFKCEEDEEMNICIGLKRWSDSDPWNLNRIPEDTIHSLRYLDEFKIYLLKLYQSFTAIELDIEHAEEYVEIEAEPEASYS